ncbi:MAG: sugar phosphate isomerase/epimerase [Bernardetiaceae bacterium]|nr:sugar phosphate isomerase/epimerase [Bernardetiaceae bacterium]
MKQFLVAVACLLASAAGAQTANIGGKKLAIGLEIYSLRAALSKDVPGTLAKIKAMGFKELEVSDYYGLSPEAFKKEMDKLGLKCTSMFFGYDRFQKDVEGIRREAKLFGAKFVGCGWIKQGENAVDLPQMLAAVDVFNKAGETLKKDGIRVFYHLHGYEFIKLDDGRTGFDAMMAAAKPGLLDFQMDTYWAWHGGADPVALLEKYPGRFVSLHLKDMKKGEPVGLTTGHADVETNVVLGTGQLDFAKLMAAAVRTGVKQYFIEDESSAVEQQLPQTLAYLKTLK